MSKRALFGIAFIAAAVVIFAGTLHLRTEMWSRIDAADLVARALTQEHNAKLSYIAQVRTVTGYSGESVETRATVLHQGDIERIEYAGPRGRSVWSMTEGDRSYTYVPARHTALVTEASRLLSTKDRVALLLRNFTATCVGAENVAGRYTYVIDLSSRYDGRPSKKLWIDPEHFTVLRAQDFSASRELRGTMEMDRVVFGAKIDPKTFSDAPRTQMLCKSGYSKALFAGLGFEVNLPKYLPRGYWIEGYHLLNSTCGCQHHSAQLTYTDGLNVISVFQTPRMVCCKSCNMGNKCDDQNCGIATMGQVKRADKTIVVVGDLLPEEINKIAESVR